jgi:hypothetical protein
VVLVLVSSAKLKLEMESGTAKVHVHATRIGADVKDQTGCFCSEGWFSCS